MSTSAQVEQFGDKVIEMWQLHYLISCLDFVIPASSELLCMFSTYWLSFGIFPVLL